MIRSLCFVLFVIGATTAIDPDVNRDAVQLIASKGYPVEQHDITTEDGYILTMQRIPYGKSGPGTKFRPVVYLQHGLLCSSTNWITNLANESLGFILADNGFDVWLGNFRGNWYSRSHKTLDPKKHPFWEFSWDEMAKYDIPAMTDYVLNKTGTSSLYYAGHSEGTMTAFAQFSQDIEFSKKIKYFFALAPVAKVKHVKGLLGLLGNTEMWYQWIVKLVDNNEFLPKSWVTKILADTLCGIKSTNPLCSDVFFLIAGPNSNQLNSSRVPVYVAHTPAGTSTQNMIHFSQWLIRTLDPNEFLPKDIVTKAIADIICGHSYTNPLCSDILFLISGPNSNQLNDTRIPVYISHTPAGTSTQNMIHFAQGVQKDTFQMFDYGSAKANQLKYNQDTPPLYHPELMKVPVTLYSGDLDWLADPQDVQYLKATLTSISNQVELVDFNHMDFIWGMRAAKEVYADIIETIWNIEKTSPTCNYA